MRFFRRGTSEAVFAPAVADPTAPTRTEITNGTPLTNEIADVNGFELSNDNIGTPDLSDTFTGQIDGEDTVSDSSLTFYDDEAGGGAPGDIRAALAKGTQGFIILMPYGDVAGRRAEVWPVKSNGVNDEWSLGNDPARFVIGFAVQSRPTQNATIPA